MTEKNPPTEIPEGTEKKQPGTLTYTDERSHESPRGSGSMSMAKILLIILISVGLSLVVTFNLAASKNDAKVLESNIKDISAKTAKTSDDLAGQVKRVDNIVTALTEYAKQSQLNTYAKSSDLSSYAKSSDLNGYARSSDLSSYAKSNDLTQAITDLKARITDLEEIVNGNGLVPTITSFSPTSGNTGTSITILGTNLTAASAVSFGNTAAQSYTVNSAAQITAVVGNGSTGNVSVTTSGGTAVLGTFTFTGVATPTISSFSPMSGTTGTSVIINGTNFNNVTSVSFGGVAAQSFVVNSTTQITAVVGSGAIGLVTVTTATGTANSASTFSFSGASQGSVFASIVGNPTMSLASANGTTVNVSIQNNSGKAIYAEQIGLTFQFLNPPSAISTWGLLLNGASNNPSYSIVPGIVSYVWSAGAYITPGTSQTISVTLTTPALTVYPQYFQATASITGYSSL